MALIRIGSGGLMTENGLFPWTGADNGFLSKLSRLPPTLRPYVKLNDITNY